MSSIASIARGREAEILQTPSAKSVSAIDPNNIERDYSTISFCATMFMASCYVKPQINK